MLDSQDSKRPERRSALIAIELARLKVDIAALSEVRFPEEGSLRENGGGYTLYWSGKPATERRLSGVGFMVKNTIASKLETLPTGHSDRIMSMRMPLSNDQHVTLFSIYSPTLQADQAEKDKFYSELRTLVKNAPSEDKILILGDFNARVGQDSEAWKGVLGKHGVGKCNDNGRLLLELCSELQLVITNTIFQQKDSHKTTWMHPRSKHWHLIDYVLVRKRDLKDVLHTRVMPSAECHTDHRLVRCKLKLVFKPKPKKRGPLKKKLNLNTLKDPEMVKVFQAALQEALRGNQAQTDTSPETAWEDLKSTVLQTSEKVLGYSVRRNRDWFDENDYLIMQLLEKKRTTHQAYLSQPSCQSKKAAFRLACRNLQVRLREMQNLWWNSLATRTQWCADTGDYKGFYEGLKVACGPSHQIQSPLRSADGHTLFTDKASIMNRWSEHFQSLFSASRTVHESAILRIPQVPTKPELDLPPTLEETIKAIEKLKNGKAAGGDGIPAEIWKKGGETLQKNLHKLFVCCWENEVLPKELRDAVIITLYKNKGEKSDCSNYRGITLLSIAGKILARILLNRLVPSIADEHIPESQCGFRANRGTTDMVFVLRQLQEKCREQNKGLYITFVDLTKAFDTVSRNGLWLILNRLGCPQKFLNMIMQLHEGQYGQVRLNENLSEPFPITNGVKQGCVLAPTLFSIFFSMMLKQAIADLEDDEFVYVRYRFDGSLFNLRRLQAHTKVHEQLVKDLLFADDAALVAHSERALQLITSCFAEAAQLFGLEVSLKKTEVLHQPAPLEAQQPPHITIGETELNCVQQFTYLGCTISSDARIDKEIDNRLAKANRAFGRLYKRVWESTRLKRTTKINVYRAMVLSTLLYGSESWVTYRSHIRLLERFHQRCLRTILKIHWTDHITNIEVLKKADIPSIEAMILKSQLRWAGHVSRMEDHRLPKITLFGELSSGHRNRGAPKKRYKDTLKKSLHVGDISVEEWSDLAQNREIWRQTINKAATSFETTRRNSIEDKRKERKQRAATTPDPEHTLPCRHCNRPCRSRIGLQSHERACRKRGQPS